MSVIDSIHKAKQGVQVIKLGTVDDLKKSWSFIEQKRSEYKSIISQFESLETKLRAVATELSREADNYGVAYDKYTKAIKDLGMTEDKQIATLAKEAMNIAKETEKARLLPSVASKLK